MTLIKKISTSSLAWPFIWCKFKRIQSIICQLTFYVAALSCFYTFLLGSFLCAISRRQKEIGSKVHKRCFSFILIYNHSFVHRKVENLSGSPFVSIWRKSFCNVWQLNTFIKDAHGLEISFSLIPSIIHTCHFQSCPKFKTE